MPRFIDEAHRERWMEGQRLAREAKKKQAQQAALAPPCTTVVKALPKPRKPAPVVESIVVTPSSLDAAIDQLRGDLEALERAKTILERHPA